MSSPLSDIRAILEAVGSDGSAAQSMQAANAAAKKHDTTHTAPTTDKGTEVLRSPAGVEEVKAFIAKAPSATHPMHDSKSKNSSSSKSLATEAKDEEDGEDKGDKSDKKANFLANLKKGKKKSDDKETTEESVKVETGPEDEEVVETPEGETEETSEENTTMSEAQDLTQHIDALFNGETLSEDFKNKAKTILEAVVQEKENSLRAALVEEYEAVVEVAINDAKIELAEKLDSYLNYVVEQYMEENKLEVERGLKLEITESFFTALRGVFLEHNIEVPEAKIDLVAELHDKTEELETKLSEEIEANVKLTEMLDSFQKNELVAQISEGLSSIQKDKFKTLSESVSFDGAEECTKKLQIIKESYFGKGTTKPAAKSPALLSEETTRDEMVPDESENNQSLTEELSPIMNDYVNVLSRSGSKRK